MFEPARIQVTKTGPYLVSGNFSIVDADGNAVEVLTERVALCRCGLSAKKPFCDGTHKTSGFCQETGTVTPV